MNCPHKFFPSYRRGSIFPPLRLHRRRGREAGRSGARRPRAGGQWWSSGNATAASLTPRDAAPKTPAGPRTPAPHPQPPTLPTRNPTLPRANQVRHTLHGHVRRRPCRCHRRCHLHPTCAAWLAPNRTPRDPSSRTSTSCSGTSCSGYSSCSSTTRPSPRSRPSRLIRRQCLRTSRVIRF